MSDDARELAAEVVAGLIALALLVGVAVGWDRCASPAGAQDDLAVALARTCVSERGWALETDDCAAIWAVVQHRAREHGTSESAALRALSPRLHGEGPIGREWIRDLGTDGGRPSGWPHRASWSRRSADWAATLTEARAIVLGERPSPCASEPSAWGSAEDVRRRRRTRRWIDVDCGHTRNRFGGWR